MWANKIFIQNNAKGIVRSKNKFFKSLMLTIAIVAILVSLLPFAGAEQGYTNTTKKCLSCHNDTGYPADTDMDGVAAPYKRPHNNITMCEYCHKEDPHIIKFIQPDGGYGDKSTAASCPNCHQNGIVGQNNANFTNAPLITPAFIHSQNILNGSIWGNYWTNTSLNTACKYCHDNTLHNISAFGRILLLFPGYLRYGELADNYTCSGCHYKDDPKWSLMNLTFTSAGLPIPPEITNGTNWNGISFKYYNHSLRKYDDSICKTCHGGFLSANANMSEFVHNVAEGAGGDECLSCHANELGKYPAINATLFGKHRNVNITDGGLNTLQNSDCRTCHYNSSNMSDVLTYTCISCHDLGNFSAPIIQNHQPDGVNIKTAAYCATCHNNSINMYAYSENASVGHYGTNTTLLKPTVNQTTAPRFGFATAAEALDYNKDCNNCHNPSNPAYGNATKIDYPHTTSAICNQCHLVNNANNLHNVSLRIPGSYSCRDCHVNAAIGSQFGAPNILGTGKENLGTCANCHGLGDEIFDSLIDHNTSRTYPTGKGGFTDTVYLNGQLSLTVTKGDIVTITSKVNDSSGTASKVAGAEYFIGNDPGKSRGIPMNAVDGNFDAVKARWENVTATIDTNSLASGTYLINVRGMDIGKQWSQVQNATLTIQALGYINGTVTNESVPISGVYVSTNGDSDTTGDDGKYSLMLTEGNYVVKAIKHPEFDDYTISDVNVIPPDTTTRDINLIRKPNGTISGVVTD